MDFDWADETIHAHYGKKWLTELLEVRGVEEDPKIIRQECEKMVDELISKASDSERQEILSIANSMLSKAEKLASRN